MSSLVFSDSATIGGTEYSLPNDSTTLTPQTTVGRLYISIDFSALLAGDEYEVKIYEKLTSGGSQVLLIPKNRVLGVQAQAWEWDSGVVGFGWDVTVKKIVGTDRSIKWAVYQHTIQDISAADVWAAGTRTLTSFGTLAADVWAVATRLLTAGTNIVLAKGTGVTGFNDLSAAQVNAEVDTALADAQLDEFVDMIELDGSLYRFTVAALANAPSGGGGLTAADVWAYTTRLLTAGTNIVLAKGVGVTGFNDVSTAQVRTEVDGGLVAYDAATDADLDAAQAAIIDAVPTDVENATAVWANATRSLTTFGTLVTDVATAVWGFATRLLTAGTNIVLAKGTGITGFNDLSEAQVNAQVDLAITDASLDKFVDMIELDGLLYRFTIEALANAPAGGGGGGGATAAQVWAYAQRTLTAGVTPTINPLNAATLELTLVRGDDYIVNPIQFTGMPVLTGATILFKIGEFDEEAFETETACTYSAGVVSVALSRDITDTLLKNSYDYTLESTLASHKRTLARGKLVLKGKVLDEA